jgi:hypothetical protein
MQKRTVRYIRYKGFNVEISTGSALDPVALHRDIQTKVADDLGLRAICKKYKIVAPDKIRLEIQRSRFDRRKIVNNLMIRGANGSVLGSVLVNGFMRTRDIVKTWESALFTLRLHAKRYDKAQVASMLPYEYLRATPGMTRPGDVSFEGASEFQLMGSRRSGWVHTNSGDYLRVHQARRSKVFFRPIRPVTDARYIGIEMEMGIKCDRAHLATLFGEAALHGQVMIKSDGSINSLPSGYEAVELNLCAPHDIIDSVVDRVTAILARDDVKAVANKSCGLHVHLDVRGKPMADTQAGFDRLMSIQSILYGMQPKSRQDNTYCLKAKTRSIVRGVSRYQGLNAQSIWKYSTVEVRLHSGTTDATKVKNWVELLTRVFYSDRVAPQRALRKLDSLPKYFNVPTRLMEYVVERTRKFANATEESTAVEA